VRRTAAGLFALFVLVYLWPALVQGHLLSPVAGLYYDVPWEGVAPHGVGAYVNRQLEDATMLYYPWQHLARQLVHAGTFPAWNPYAFAGTPFFANAQVAWLSPFSWLMWILPFHYAFGLVAALKLWLAGFGTYLLVRELRLSFWPAMLAGVSFALCAFDVVWLAHGVQVSVAVLFPWTLWLVERIVRRGRALDGLALAGIVALVLTGGHPGTQLHVLSAAVLYALARAALSTDLAGRERLRRLGVVGAALGVGLLVTAVTLLPAQQAARGTAGTYARSHGSVEFSGARLPFGALRTALFPDWWGRTRVALGPGPADYNERTFYAGVAALVLAVAALGAPGAWRRKAPFAGLAAIGVAVALRAPGLDGLVRSLPGFDTVQNQRILLWFLMAVAVLGAFGLQALLDAPRGWPLRLALGTALAVPLVALATLGFGGASWSAVRQAFLHRSMNADDPAAALALASVGWWVVFAAALAATLLAAARLRGRGRTRAVTGGLVVLIAALDLLHFAHGWQPMGPAERAVPPVTPAIAYLQRHARASRIAGIDYALLNDFSNVYGLHEARGYDPPQPSMRFFHLWQAVLPQTTPGGAYLAMEPSEASVRLLGMLGVRYLVTDAGASARSRQFTTAYAGRDATILENAAAMPRAIVASYVEPGYEESQQIRTATERDFDPRTTAIAPHDEIGAGTQLAGGRGTVRVVRERNAEVTLRASAPGRALVVLDDAWAPGWSVTVDGRPARALQADVVLRGVLMPAGAHTIVWRYRVPGLALGAALSALGLALAVAWGGWLALAARRRARARDAPARPASSGRWTSA
jgi:hypothetical protein